MTQRLYLWKLSPYSLGLFPTISYKLILSIFISMVTSPQSRKSELQVWLAGLPPLNSSQSSFLPGCPAFPLLPCYSPWAVYWTNQRVMETSVYKMWCRWCFIKITVPKSGQHSALGWYRDQHLNNTKTTFTRRPRFSQHSGSAERKAMWSKRVNEVTVLPVSELDLYF